MLQSHTTCQKQMTKNILEGFLSEMLPSYSYGEYMMPSQTQIQSRSRKSRFSSSRSTRFTTDHLWLRHWYESLPKSGFLVASSVLDTMVTGSTPCCPSLLSSTLVWAWLEKDTSALTPLPSPPKTGFPSPSCLLWHQTPALQVSQCLLLPKPSRYNSLKLKPLIWGFSLGKNWGYACISTCESFSSSVFSSIPLCITAGTNPTCTQTPFKWPWGKSLILKILCLLNSLIYRTTFPVHLSWLHFFSFNMINF